MVISHRYRFIFIKTRKTASTSIEAYLSGKCGPDDVLTPVRPPVPGHRPRNHRGWFNPLPELLSGVQWWRKTVDELFSRKRFWNHMPARLVRHRVSRRVWSDYFKFAVERNPWDKNLSFYHMMKERTGGDLTLDESLERHDCSDFGLYTGPGGGLLVDEVLRYEALSEELDRVFGRLGVPFDGELGVRAKSGHRSDRRPYREVLTRDQAELIHRRHRSEIELLGYGY